MISGKSLSVYGSSLTGGSPCPYSASHSTPSSQSKKI